MPWWLALAAMGTWTAALFWLAHWGDHRAERPAGPLRRATYGLGIAVYCTSWTFYGAVGTASQSGWDYLPIYLGPALVFTLGLPVLRKLLRVGREQHSSSIADFLAARYGKSRDVAALVTLIATVGVLPYIALQLKSVSTSITALGSAGGAPASPHDASVLVTALVLAAFAILFGTRHLDMTRPNRGMMLAIAAQSALKLLALGAVAVVCAVAFGGAEAGAVLGADRGTGVAVAGSAVPLTGFASADVTPRFVALTLLAAAAMLCLPRQFHVTVVECEDRSALPWAAAIVVLVMVLVSAAVVPIVRLGWATGLANATDPDLLVLALPLAMHHEGTALLAALGGFAAASSMVIVASVALSTMITQDLLLPLLLRRSRLLVGDSRNFPARLLVLRRVVIVGVLLLAYLNYLGLAESSDLAGPGIASFAAVAQFLPALLGALYWRRGHRLGVLVGLALGAATWLWLFGPGAGLLPRPAPGGAAALVDPVTFGVVASLTVNVAAYVVVSLLATPSAVDREQADAFVGRRQAPDAANPSDPAATLAARLPAGISVADVNAVLQRALGADETRAATSSFARLGGGLPGDDEIASAAFIAHQESRLARVIGAASARILLRGAFAGDRLPARDVLTVIDETSRKIRFSEELLRTTLEHLDQGIVVWDDGQRLLAWNAAFERAFAVPPGLLVAGRHARDITACLAAPTEEASRAAFLARQLTRIATGAPYAEERSDVSGRVYLVRGTQVPGHGYLESFTDITHYTRVARALRESERSIRFYLDNVPALISFSDPQQRIVFANHAYRRVFEPPGRSIVGMRARDFLGEDEYTAREPWIRRVLEGERVMFDITLPAARTRRAGAAADAGGAAGAEGPDDMTFYQVTYVPQSGEDGTLRGFFGLYQDVTARVRAEQALRETNETLEARVRERTAALSAVNEALRVAREEAVGATRSKTRFLAAASHDLLQPLNAARLFTSALAQGLVGSGDTAARELVDNIDKSITSADRLLRSLLDISKLDAGGLKPDFTTFPVAELLDEIATEFTARAAARGLTFRCMPCSLSIRSDRGLLLSVLQNLVSNAVRYTDRGRVLVGVRRGGSTLRLQVLDTGRGIPENRRDEVFREFSQLERDARLRESGVGLGLAITERIARLLGHPLQLDSTEGRGTVFTLTLPVAGRAGRRDGRLGAPPAAHAADAAGAPAAAAAVQAGGLVLCVDNEPAVLDGLRALLERWGHRVVTARDMDEVAHWLRGTSEAPDVLLLDYQLDHGETGFDVLDLVAVLGRRPRGVALLTAMADLGDLQRRAADRGVTIMRKPTEPAALRAFLNRVLGPVRRSPRPPRPPARPD